MEIQLNLNGIIAALLLTVRLGMLVIFSPIPALNHLPVKLRILFTFSLALLMSILLPISFHYQNIHHLFLSALGECMIGGLFAFGIHLTFAAFQFAGKFVETQMGLNAESVLNPYGMQSDSILSTFFILIATALFFACNGMENLIQGVSYSIETFPPGSSLSHVNFSFLIPQVGHLFIYGVMLAAPVVCCLSLVDIGSAIVAKSMPQVNIYFVSLPIKIFLGLWITAFSFRYMGPLVETVFTDLFQFWNKTLMSVSHG